MPSFSFQVSVLSHFSISPVCACVACSISAARLGSGGFPAAGGAGAWLVDVAC